MLPDIKDSDLLTAAQLRIYADKTTYEDKNGRALKSSDLVKNLGQDAASALIVEVPASPPKKRLKTLWQEQTTLDPNTSALSLDGRGHVWSLAPAEDTKHHVVFLDGVTQNDTELKVCTGWVRQKWDTRRLVLVTSMSSRRKVKLDDDAGKKAMQHNVPAWSEDEYLNAVEDDELFQSVLPFLDASDDEEVPTDAASMRTWRELILLSKYYFAGGNARYMFGYPTATVMEALDDAVKAAVDNPPAAIGLVWEQSASVIA